MRYSYDAEVDALSILLLPEVEIARTLERGDNRHIDLSADGRVVAIEVLWASDGVEVDDLIYEFDLDNYKSFLRDVANASFKPAVAL